MKATTPTLLLAGSGLTLAAPGQSLYQRAPAPSKRWDYDVCQSDCALAGIPIPDKDNFQLPLEHLWSEQCPPTYIPGSDATSRVCLEFVGPYVYFKFSPFPGYTYENAAVGWTLMGDMRTPNLWNPPPPPSTGTVLCEADGEGLVCKLPFSDILNVSSTTGIKDLLSGMCPNSDSEGLGLYLQFSGNVKSAAGTLLPFRQQYPCASRDSNRQCTAWNNNYDYIEISYRCTKCNVLPCTTATSTSSPTTSATASPAPCDFGTAFGYQSAQKSYTLDTQSGQGCNRWGWYETPTLAELQGGISGPLYVGAGGNDISKATNVGIWTAKASTAGQVTVTYLTTPLYSLAEVHVDLACLPIDKCAPGSYTFGRDGLGGVSTFTTPQLQYPSCSGGSRAALIIHAAISQTGICLALNA
ncbi:hypothetical protein MFIFM68171_10707 [Madurella fahalii]|uniref:Uncharacterized protein n=1 Tax=Madurella fahalii TaxID=1157608 RepID=A0ABQ0GRZ0_9PEZI